MLISYAFQGLRFLQEDYTFQQDGAPLPYSNPARDYNNKKGPANRIEIGVDQVFR